MILTLRQKFDLELPTGWRELPPAHVLAVGHWIFEWVEELGTAPELKADLIRSLGEAANFVLANLSDDRSWVAILDPSTRGRVVAVASIDAMPRVRADDTAIPVGGVVVWRTDIHECTIAGHDAVVQHNLGVYTDNLGDPTLAERYVGTVYPEDSDDAVRLDILAESIDVFGDIVAHGNRVLDGLAFATEA